MSDLSLGEALIRGALKMQQDGKEIDFVFVGNSLLHMSSLNAWLMKEASCGRSRVGIVCNDIAEGKRPQFGASEVVGYADGNIYYIQDHVDYEVERTRLDRLASLFFTPFDLKKIERLRLFKEVTFLYPDHGMPCEAYWMAVLGISKKITCVAIEEGIASYLPIESESSLFAYLATSPFSRAYEIMKIKLLARRKEAVRNKIRRQVHIERFGIFKTAEQCFNREVDVEYRDWMKAFFLSHSVSDDDSLDFSNTVVVLGTANEDFVDQKEVNALLAEVFSVIRQAGYKTYYRPHPRQAEKIVSDPANGLLVDGSSGVPIEEVIARASHKPVATIGFCSTAQLIAKVFWNIPAIGISAPLLARILEKSYPEASIQFCKRLVISEKSFPKYFSVVENISEIGSRLA